MKVLLLLGLGSIYIALVACNPCEDGWEEFGDEKCYKLVESFLNWTEAERTCESFNENGKKGNLINVKFADQQSFITEFLFTKKGISDNIWLGASRVDSKHVFRWTDNSVLTYQNWFNKHPRNETSSNCIEMLSGSMFPKFSKQPSETEKAGDWINTRCNKHNYFVCEKTQNYDLAKLSKLVLELVEDLKSSTVKIDNLEVKNTLLEKEVSSLKKLVANSTVIELKKNISDLQSETDKLAATTTQLKNKDIYLEKIARTAPENTIYVQYPFEELPMNLWNCSGRWSDISSTYSGLFFRVLGSNSGSWRHVQAENTTSIQYIMTTDICNEGTSCFDKRYEVVRDIKTGWSEPFFTAYHNYISNGIGLKFYTSSGEVRPRNMAIKIWKCVS